MNKPPPFVGNTTLLLIFVLLVTSCQQQFSGSSVWIDVPVNNLTLPAPQTLQIEGHASSPEGISRVEIFINGALLLEVNDLEREGNLSRFQASWTPAGPGNYVIQVAAYEANGNASALDSTLVIIGGGTATLPAITEAPATPNSTGTQLPPTATITLPATLTALPEAVIHFWADPQTISAGACTNLHWNISNVRKVVFGGMDQSFTGSDDECPCATSTYSLTVTHLDGQQETVYTEVTVSGSCDSTPPPAPAPSVPANGLSLSCRASQNLTWLPVSDPSGITEYQVQVERSSDNATWTTAPGSPVTGLSQKTTSIITECGWYYRWRVRALDGKGNVGEWSPWSKFSIVLS